MEIKLTVSRNALDVKGAAEFLGMSVSWVYKQVSSETLEHFKIGRSVRFDPVKLHAWREAQRKIGVVI